jgi:hypothetical protein
MIPDLLFTEATRDDEDKRTKAKFKQYNKRISYNIKIAW